MILGCGWSLCSLAERKLVAFPQLGNAYSCVSSLVANKLSSSSLSLGKGNCNDSHLSACLFSKSVKKLNIVKTITALLKMESKVQKLVMKGGKSQSVPICPMII